MNEEIILEKFSERFSELIKSSSFDISKLAQKLGIKSKSTIYRYMNAEMAPKISTVKYASEIFNVNPLWLMGYNVSKYNTVDKLDKLGNLVIPIPLLGTVKAGYDYMAQENWEGTIELDKKVADTGEFFALKVKGDSMIPAFFEGDIVIIRRQNDCENNQVAVVIVNGDEGTLKKVKKTDEGIILQPFNTAYGPVMYTNKEIKETPIIIAGIFQELRRTELKF